MVHLASGLFLVYFWVPQTVFVVGGWGMPKPLLLILMYLFIPVAMEVWRHTVKGGKTFFMLRDYEEGRVAAYLWTVTAAVLLLLLTEVGIPQYIAGPCILVSSWGDPTLGEARSKRLRRRYIYTLGWIVCTLIFLLFRYWFPMALLAGFISVVAESFELEVSWGFREEMFRDFEKKSLPFKEIKKLNLSDRILKTDDNFVMIVIPFVILTLIWLAFNLWNIDWGFPSTELISEYPHPFFEI